MSTALPIGSPASGATLLLIAAVLLLVGIISSKFSSRVGLTVLVLFLQNIEQRNPTQTITQP